MLNGGTALAEITAHASTVGAIGRYKRRGRKKNMKWTTVEKTDINDTRYYTTEYLDFSLYLYDHEDGLYEGVLFNDKFFCNLGTANDIETMKTKLIERAKEIIRILRRTI